MNNEKTILVIEDEKGIRNFIHNALTTNGYKTILAENGKNARTAFLSQCPDLVLLDLGLPDADGLTLLQEFRQWNATPVLIVSARDKESEKVSALDMGADDYITKPFNSREVVARVKAVLRRAGTQEKKGEVSRITYPGLIIDMDQYQVTAFGNKMTFTTKEMELLWCLASNPGKAFSRNQLLETIWGYSYYGDTRTVDTHIKRIRQKLNIPPDSKWDITTIWGVGYKFELKDE